MYAVHSGRTVSSTTGDIRSDQAFASDAALGWCAVLSACRQAPRVARDRRDLPALPRTVRQLCLQRIRSKRCSVIPRPVEGLTLKLGAKVPGTSMQVRDVTMDFAYGRVYRGPRAYERLISMRLRFCCVPPPARSRARGRSIDLSFWEARDSGGPGVPQSAHDVGPRWPFLEEAVIITLKNTTSAGSHPRRRAA